MTEREQKQPISRSLGTKGKPRRLGVAPGGAGDRARDSFAALLDACIATARRWDDSSMTGRRENAEARAAVLAVQAESVKALRAAHEALNRQDVLDLALDPLYRAEIAHAIDAATGGAP